MKKYFKRKSSGKGPTKESNVQKISKNTHIVLHLNKLPFDHGL